MEEIKINKNLKEIDREIQKLNNTIDKVKALKTDKIEFNNQRKENIELLIRNNIKTIFGKDSLEYDKYKYHKISHGMITLRDSPERRQMIFENGIEQTIIMLEGLIENLKEKKTDIQYNSQKSYIDIQDNVDDRNIFLANSYINEDDEFAQGFKKLLTKEGYNVLLTTTVSISFALALSKA